MPKNNESTLEIPITLNPELSVEGLKEQIEEMKKALQLEQTGEMFRKVEGDWGDKRVKEAADWFEKIKEASGLTKDNIEEVEKKLQQIGQEAKKITGKDRFKSLGKGISGGLSDSILQNNEVLAALKKGPEGFGNLIGQKIYGALKSGADYLAKVFDDFNEIVQNSYLTNATTRRNAFSYGMTSAESFGFEKAKGLLNIQNTEDLMYMNDFQSKKFRELMSKYTEQYSKLYEQGFFDKMLEFQIAQEDFKFNFEMKVMELFMQNKDLIINALDAILDIANWVMSILPNVSGTSDSIINEINSKKISVDTTFNISGDVNKQMLINAGQQTVGLMEEQIYNLP